MTRPIRRIAFVLALMLIALLVNVTIIQVVLAGDYRDRPGNQRVLLEEYAREILTTGKVLADVYVELGRNSRAIQVSDEMLQQANQIIR